MCDLTANRRPETSTCLLRDRQKILGYRWFDFKSTDQLPKETSMKNISELIFERQMSMFGYVAKLFSDDSAHMIRSCDKSPGCKHGEEDRLARWWEIWRGCTGGLEPTGCRLGLFLWRTHWITGTVCAARLRRPQSKILKVIILTDNFHVLLICFSL